jgi:putative ABC transport system permease protein
VVISVFAEALALSLVGAGLGALAAWLFFDGNVINSSAGGGGISQLVFTLALTPALVSLGIIWACVIGLVGGLFPALRAARLPVAQALRAV